VRGRCRSCFGVLGRIDALDSYSSFVDSASLPFQLVGLIVTTTDLGSRSAELEGDKH